MTFVVSRIAKLLLLTQERSSLDSPVLTPASQEHDEHYIRTALLSYGRVCFTPLLSVESMYPHTTLTIERRLYTTGLYSDLLIYSGNSSFKVHKYWLHIQSPVFRSMLKDRLQRDDAGKDFIRLDDDDSVTLGLLFEFLYTSTYNEPLGLETMDGMQMSLNVYKLAEKYKIPNLCSVATKRLSDAVMVCLEQNEVNICIETLRQSGAFPADTACTFWDAIVPRMAPKLSWLARNDDFCAMLPELPVLREKLLAAPWFPDL
ncbi:hypothetical protein LTR56_021153 [Elasticomyces elasticus]|nr:hypothetical protein LTR56_021153 [Elasticomyces elasticus]KAK3631828.1 hypothetical protein LTR22_020896 [Elasticomyces elasticus]KAK4909684.1 hypothetical protein LTR49_021578 [Elasticomyces elasticus]KAK5749546.1 hypothetical protein LTS12_020412 [Elasticomyces elasticus]